MEKRLCSCCNRKTCPKNQVPVQDEEPSSQKSSALEYTDKGTQKTASPSSAVTSADNSQPSKSAATSETHLNRNNENLNIPPTTLPCPTTVPKYNQTDCVNYPSIMSKVTCQHERHTTTQCQCMQPTTLYLQEPCETREEFETSSSGSTLSEHFPIKLKLNMKTHNTRAEYIIMPGTGICPERLPTCATKDPKLLTPETSAVTEDDYFSCSSESSDTETPTALCTVARPKSSKVRVKRKDRDSAILHLLHQVVHLINEDQLKEIESTEACKHVTSSTVSNKSCDQGRLPDSSSSSKCQQLVRTQQATSGTCGALRSLLDELKDTIDSCGPCAELRTLLNSTKYKSEESQSMSEDCAKMPAKCVDKEDATLSSCTNETLDNQCDCDCVEEPAERQAADKTPPPQPFLHPCPCYCYYMSLLASSQGMPMPLPVPEGVHNYASLKFPTTQKEIKEGCQCDMEPPKEVAVTEVDRDVESSVHTIKDNRIASRSLLEPISEKSYIFNDNEETALDAANNQTAQNLNTTENDNNEMAVSSAKLGLTAFERYELEFGKLHVDEETPRTNDLTPKKYQTDFEQPQDLTLFHIERLGSTLAKDMYLRPNLLDINEPDAADKDYLIDDYCEEFDDECELGKEKRAESLKRKDPCDCCHCRETAKGKCMSVATPQQVDIEEGVNEFKYFIDSLILDLDAMEHARRKCDVIRNVCMPKPGVRSRESFPVTIKEVQDLGTTSLYVKWTIHDCYGIGGYEIYVDGYLTNRYYHSRHESAVITDVDITMPHKVALVAQPSLKDDSLKMLCSPHKNPKTKCQAKAEHKKSYTTPTSLWTPSIYLYDPAESKASQALPTIKYTTSHSFGDIIGNSRAQPNNNITP